MNNKKLPALTCGGSLRRNIAPCMFELKAQIHTSRIAELHKSAEFARRKARVALKLERTTSACFIRAVVELSGAAPYSLSIWGER